MAPRNLAEGADIMRDHRPQMLMPRVDQPPIGPFVTFLAVASADASQKNKLSWGNITSAPDLRPNEGLVLGPYSR